jgi:O-antigen/teichoic acid export membrane protein
MGRHVSSRRFSTNVLWSWAAVAANLAMAFLLSPIMIRKLGDEAYGLWTLAYSIVDYYNLLDLGFRSAIVKHVAHWWTLEDRRQLAQVVNTGIAYFVGVATALCALTVAVSPFLPRLFHVSAAHVTAFSILVLSMGLTCAMALPFGCLAACLEAAQRFDLSNRILMIMNVTRVVSVLVLLLAGYGLVAVALAAAAARLLQFVLIWRTFQRHLPIQWSRSLVHLATLRDLYRYGVHTLPSTVAWMLLQQGPGLVIGGMLSARFVGYYSLPAKLSQYVQELVHRLGSVTNARTAELAARQDFPALRRLGVATNRYSLLIFMPAALFLTVYSEPLFRVWLTPQFAAASAPLAPWFAIGYLLGEVGQFNSCAILYGLARHQRMTRFLLYEALASTAALCVWAKSGSLLGAAVSACVLMILNRGLVVPWLLCGELRIDLGDYMREIYTRPLALGAVSAAVLVLCRATWLSGYGYVSLLTAGVLTCVLWGSLAARFCLFPEHQAELRSQVARRAPWLGGVAHALLGGERQSRA